MENRAIANILYETAALMEVALYHLRIIFFAEENAKQMTRVRMGGRDGWFAEEGSFAKRPAQDDKSHVLRGVGMAR